MKGAERAGAGCVDNAVGASQVVLLADPPCHHVAEQAGEGVFLPGDIGIADALHHIFCHAIVYPCFLEGRTPDRMPETGAERDNQLQ